MNALILGHVCADRNVSEKATYNGPGSPVMFINTIYRQFPYLNVEIIAPYGPDYLQYLKGISIQPRSPNCNATLTYENVSKNRIRTQKAFNRDEASPVPLSEELRLSIQNSDIIFFAPLLPTYPASYIKEVMSASKPEVIKVLLPQGYFRDFDTQNNVITREFKEADDILSLIDIVIISEQDHPNVIPLAKEWTRKHNIVCVVTLGEKGAVAFHDNEEISLPARPVSDDELVDSVGAGDVFSAAFAYKYQQIRDIKQAGLFANEVARQSLFYTASKIKIDLSKISIL